LRSEARRAAERDVAERPAPRRSVTPEGPPVVSGRFFIAALIVGAMLLIPFSPLAGVIEKKGPGPTDTSTWKVGGTGDVRITLITADYNLLACASEQSIQGKHCAHKTETEPWPRDPSEPLDDNKKNIIQPYRTWPDNKLIFAAGLWADPALALRLHREPPEGVPAKKLARFVIECRSKFIGRLDDPKLRWAPGQAWIREGGALVAEPQSCSIFSAE
jgi:hypothetical protein